MSIAESKNTDFERQHQGSVMDLIVVRHGETWANAEHRYLGSLDPSLTEIGRTQAKALIACLPRDIDLLVVSPRARARETADIVNQERQLPVTIMNDFQERDVSVFEGLTQQEAQARYPKLWSQNVTRQWDAAPTGGESIADMVRRIQRGLIQLEAEQASKTVLIVAHGFVAKVIRALGKGDFSDFFEWQLPNGHLLALENFEMPVTDAEILKASLPIS